MYARRLADCGVPLDGIAYHMSSDEATVVQMIAGKPARPVCYDPHQNAEHTAKMIPKNLVRRPDEAVNP